MVRKKRKHNQRNNNNEDNNRNQKRRISHINRDELVIYRILCPIEAIGGVIGKNGQVITEIRDITKAKIKVFDRVPNCSHRVITIYCSLVKDKKLETSNSETGEPLCCAQDALHRVHDAIMNSYAILYDKTSIDNKECRLLVPFSQSSALNINMIRIATGASVKIVPKDVSDPSHACAMEFDTVVVISGEPESVKRALFSVSSIMYQTNPQEHIPIDSTTPQQVSSSNILPLGHIHQHGFQGYAETVANPMPAFHGFWEPSISKELVLKVLCPLSNLGRVVGVRGSTVKELIEASGSRIEVDRSMHGDDECVIVVTATESRDDMKSMAVEVVLLLQEMINHEGDEKVKMQLIVPSKVIGCLIGKSGSVINEIRKRTDANIRILKGNLDDLVEVSGEVRYVRDALIQIVLRLRNDVLGDSSSNNVPSRKPPARFYNNNSFFSSTSSSYPGVPEIDPVSFDQRQDIGNPVMFSSGGFYGYGSVGPYSYGGGLHPPSVLEILVPMNAVSKVIGTGGSNLENIRSYQELW